MAGGRAAAVTLIALGAVVAVSYSYGLFYTAPSTQWLLVRATLALAVLLVGAFISAVGIALLLAGRVQAVEAEGAGEGEEGR